MILIIALGVFAGFWLIVSSYIILHIIAEFLNTLIR